MSALKQRNIDFYFDFISPYSYLAWVSLSKWAEQYQLHIRPIPVLFAGLLKHYGQLGPAEIKPKAVWMYKDLLRKARALAIPLAAPASHPFNPLLALRVACLDAGEQKKLELINAIYSAVWAKSIDVSSEQGMAQVLEPLGMDVAVTVAQANAQDNKQQLIDNTQSAIDKQVFGVPSLIVDDQLFWGVDDLQNLKLYLQAQDSVSDQELQSWLKIRPSTVRKR